MTLEEKKALQSLLIDEVQIRLEEQPTLLIDALLQGNGVVLLNHIISRRLAVAYSQAQALTTLAKAMKFDRPEEAAA